MGTNYKLQRALSASSSRPPTGTGNSLWQQQQQKRKDLKSYRMANALCFSPIPSSSSPIKSGFAIDSHAPKLHRIDTFRSQNPRFDSLKSKAADSSNQRTKPNSIVCANCDGNGAVLCSQCKGNGVNSVDHFNGQFKAGGLCWLCRGKREMLCGNCNGAGFVGGFMSSFED